MSPTSELRSDDGDGAAPAPRVVFVNPTGLLSGAERVAVRYLAAARERGWGVTVCAPDGALAEELSSMGIHRVAIAELKPGPGPRLVSLARTFARALRMARRLRRIAGSADAVVVNGLIALPAIRMARLEPVVSWLVHDVVVRRELRRVVRLGAAGVDIAVAVSEAAARFPREIGVTTVVVPNGTPWPIDPRSGDWPDPPVIGVNGALTPWKGQDVVLDAVAMLPTVRLELMGAAFPQDREYEHRLRARAARPDLAGRVSFLGHVAEPLTRMRSWTVSVSSSLDPEAGPLGVLEAMSIGLPVIGTDHGGTSEVIDGVGPLVPPGDPRALADAIGALVDDPSARERAGNAGRRAIETGLTLDRAAGRFLDVLQSAISKRAPS